MYYYLVTCVQIEHGNGASTCTNAPYHLGEKESIKQKVEVSSYLNGVKKYEKVIKKVDDIIVKDFQLFSKALLPTIDLFKMLNGQPSARGLGIT